MKTLLIIASLGGVVPVPSSACSAANQAPCDQVAASFERMLTHETSTLAHHASRTRDEDPLPQHFNAALWSKPLNLCVSSSKDVDASDRVHSEH